MKKAILILSGMVIALILAAATLVMTIDPNQFKPMLTEQVQRNLGRQLVINGPISWALWPRLGLSVGEAALRNPDGFAEPDLIRLEQATASVAVLPLLSHRLEIGTIKLKGAHLLLHTRKDGSSNLDGLTTTGNTPSAAADTRAAPAPSAAAQSEAAQGADSNQPWQIRLDSIELEQASALLIDERSNRRLQLAKLDLSIGSLEPESWTPITLSLEGSDEQGRFSLSGQAELKLAPEPLQSQLRAVSLSGSLERGATHLEAVTLNAEQLSLTQPSTLQLSARGQAAEKTFDLQLATTLQATPALDTMTLTGSDLQGTLSGQGLPPSPLKLGVKGDITLDRTQQQLVASKLSLTANDIALHGDASLRWSERPTARFTLQGEKLDLDPWLASQPTKKESGKAPAASATPTAQPAAPASAEPDLSALRAVDLSGKLSLAQLTVKGITLTQPKLLFTLENGLLNLQQWQAGYDGGQLAAHGQLDSRQQPARYQLVASAKGLAMEPLLKQFADTGILSGQGELTLDASGSGLSAPALRRNIQGKLGLRVSDGAINGVNLPEMIREARATLKGQRAEYVKETRKTDFSDLTANFVLGGGKARSQDIQLFAPALRVHGEGETNLVSEQLDFLFNTSVVGTSKGQGGRDIDELKDVTIPVRISGSWSQPSYQLDLKALLQNNTLLKEKARKEAERGLNKLLGNKGDNDAVKGAADALLKGLFH